MAAPVLLAAGLARRSRPMDSIQTIVWGITTSRKLVMLDLDTGGRSEYPIPLPGEQAILAVDVFDGPRALLASGEMLRLGGRGWFRVEMVVEPERASTEQAS
jgi:hypothetical protein